MVSGQAAYLGSERATTRPLRATVVAGPHTAPAHDGRPAVRPVITALPSGTVDVDRGARQQLSDATPAHSSLTRQAASGHVPEAIDSTREQFCTG